MRGKKASGSVLKFLEFLLGHLKNFNILTTTSAFLPFQEITGLYQYCLFNPAGLE